MNSLTIPKATASNISFRLRFNRLRYHQNTLIPRSMNFKCNSKCNTAQPYQLSIGDAKLQKIEFFAFFAILG